MLNKIDCKQAEQLQKAERVLPVNEQSAFTDHKGVYKSITAKQQRDLITKTNFIKPFLQQDEQILFIAKGCSVIHPWEYLLTCWVVILFKRALFIITNKRILHTPVSGIKYKNKISQVLYADCRKLKIKYGKLTAKYWNSKKEKFPINRSHRKKLKSLLAQIPLEGFHSKAKGRSSLCPSCTDELDKGKYICQSCSLRFKSKTRSTKLSILFPGGGYFYTEKYFLAVSGAFIEVVLASVIVMNVLKGLQGLPEGFIAVFAFSLILAIVKIITVLHANHFVRQYMPTVVIDKVQKVNPPRISDLNQAEKPSPNPQPGLALDFRMH